MPWLTEVVVMEANFTQQDVLDRLRARIAFEEERGWVCFGEIVYFKNAVTQTMIPAETSAEDLLVMIPAIEKHESRGSFVPKDLVYVENLTHRDGYNRSTKCYY
jgi:hypothetical protein